MRSTTDHEIIKRWILKWDGTPALGAGSEDQYGKGVLRINFGDSPDNGQPVGWEEFFDIFDADNLLFQFKEDVIKGEEILFFNFTDRDKTPPQKDDETALPEVNELAEENMNNNSI